MKNIQIITLSLLWSGIFKIVSLQCLSQDTKDFICSKNNQSVSIPLCDVLNLHLNTSCVSIMPSEFIMDLKGRIYFINCVALYDQRIFPRDIS